MVCERPKPRYSEQMDSGVLCFVARVAPSNTITFKISSKKLWLTISHLWCSLLSLLILIIEVS